MNQEESLVKGGKEPEFQILDLGSCPQFTKTICEMASDAIIAINRSQKIIFFNKQAENLFGYSPREITGQPLENLIPERFRKEHVKHVHKFFFGSISRIMMAERPDIAGLRKDGTEFLAQISIARFIFNGEVYCSAAIRDVTLQREIQKKYLYIMKEYERSNATLQHFAHLASHDLQEPLRKIAVFSDHLQSICKERLDDKGREYLNKIHKAACRMKEMIEAVLRLAKISSIKTEFSKVSLGNTISEVMDELKDKIENSKAIIRVENLPIVNGNQTLLRILFSNLISNSLKFSKSEEPPVIEIFEKRNNDETFQIIFADNGRGFDSKYAQKIFRPFERLYGNAEFEGFGIGLTLCQTIMSHHGGFITASGKTGNGATFVLEFPMELVYSQEVRSEQGLTKE